ncbi:MAG: hypothetical protein HKN68_10130 [Saprospiraceae bacterium]|nr:hypothetical protein [Saprospiraceae bacterium]
MEFFRIVKKTTTEEEIREKVRLTNLEEWNSLLFNLNPPKNNESYIGGIWGEFTLSRQEIKGGLRFALIECPNALTWTVTTGYPPDPTNIVIHLTINRQEKGQEFIEELNEVLDDMVESLTELFSN